MNADGPSNTGLISLNGANARPGAADTGEGHAQFMANYKMGLRQHYAHTPEPQVSASARQKLTADEARDIPYWMGHYGGDNVPYSLPTAEKEQFQLREQIIAGLNQAPANNRNVMRTAPVTQGEIDMLKIAKDQAELAKFDNYVESFIDPKMPGNMQWLMKVYPQYVRRRLQKTHTDYEFALRNDMINKWGINTFDDLHFKYQIDQGVLQGPELANFVLEDAKYTPGYLSPWKWSYKNRSHMLGLPYSQGPRGHRQQFSRDDMVMGSNFTNAQVVAEMYGNTQESAAAMAA